MTCPKCSRRVGKSNSKTIRVSSSGGRLRKQRVHKVCPGEGK